MQDKLLDTIRAVSARIKNGRTLFSIWDHASGEMNELEEEIGKLERLAPQGADGVVGEAVDVILCMADVIFQFNPTISNEEILAIVDKKLAKWERVYGKKE